MFKVLNFKSLLLKNSNRIYFLNIPPSYRIHKEHVILNLSFFSTKFNGSTSCSGKIKRPMEKMPMWINAETRKKLISASRDNILRIHEFPFTYSFAKVKCELFYAILYALISLKWLCWLISSPSSEMQLRKTKEKKTQNFCCQDV